MLRLTASAGATVRLMGSLANDGAHPVTITSAQLAAPATAVDWSLWQLRPDGSSYGAHTRWHSLPVVVPAHGVVRVRITVEQPSDCAAFLARNHHAHLAHPGLMIVRWRSLLHDHVDGVDTFAPFDFRVC